MPETKILDTVNFPSDLKKLSDFELKKLANELRQETISIVSKTGGHLGSSLGVVELTVAIPVSYTHLTLPTILLV